MKNLGLISRHLTSLWFCSSKLPRKYFFFFLQLDKSQTSGSRGKGQNLKKSCLNRQLHPLPQVSLAFWQKVSSEENSFIALFLDKTQNSELTPQRDHFHEIPACYFITLCHSLLSDKVNIWTVINQINRFNCFYQREKKELCVVKEKWGRPF